MTEKPKKKFDLVKSSKIYVPLIILILILLKINKTLFYISFFTFLAYQLKMIRGRFGLKIVVLDTLHFSAVMIGRFIGIKEAVIFILINTIIVDFVTFLASDGTFANFFFYSGSTIIAVFLFGKSNIILCSAVAGLLYSGAYYFYRTFVVANAPLDVISKCITSFLFTVLYTSFFGPLMTLIMSV